MGLQVLHFHQIFTFVHRLIFTHIFTVGPGGESSAYTLIVLWDNQCAHTCTVGLSFWIMGGAALQDGKHHLLNIQLHNPFATKLSHASALRAEVFYLLYQVTNTGLAHKRTKPLHSFILHRDKDHGAHGRRNFPRKKIRISPDMSPGYGECAQRCPCSWHPVGDKPEQVMRSSRRRARSHSTEGLSICII